MKSVAERLRAIEKALNEARHAASWFSTYNGARNPEESLRHAQQLMLCASDIREQAEKLESLYVRQIDAVRRKHED